ncbi:MAG: TRAP transporter small permease subunit [Thermodesulfobacteriota bacterium]
MKEFFFVTLLKRLCLGIDFCNLWIGRAVSWLVVLLVMLVFANVLMRYCLQTSFVFLQELEWHLFAVIFLLGGGYALLKEGHVRVDIIYQRLDARRRAWINLLGVLFLLMPGCWLVIATGLPFAVTAWTMGEGSPDPGGLPYRFVLKATLAVAFFLMALQGLSLGVKSGLQLAGVPIAQGRGEPAKERSDGR